MEKTQSDLVREMTETFPQQEREWAIQRIAWFLLYGLLLAIILGLLGSGPLSETRVDSEDGSVRVEYQRFVRHHSSDFLKLTMKASSDTVRLELDSRYVSRININSVTPQPESVIADHESTTFVFNTRPNTTMSAVIEYRPEALGKLEGWVAVAGRPRQPLTQFSYP